MERHEGDRVHLRQRWVLGVCEFSNPTYEAAIDPTSQR